MDLKTPAFAATLLLCLPLSAAPKVLPNPDFTKGETIPEGAIQDWKLGATGARGWMHSDQARDARSPPGRASPRWRQGRRPVACLKVGDVLLGVAGKPFSL